MGQPIIRGIQAVGAVDVYYKYNGGALKLNTSVMRLGGQDSEATSTIETGDGLGVKCAGFRLDAEFLRANPQLASSFQIPILGGGAVALTNNNRSGTLHIRTTKVSTPAPTKEGEEVVGVNGMTGTSKGIATMYNGVEGMGIVGTETAYDLTFLLQAQQAQPGGDSVGSTLTIVFQFNNMYTIVQFQGCTVQNIDPLGLSGNDAVDYNAAINYLNWTCNYSDKTATPVA